MPGPGRHRLIQAQAAGGRARAAADLAALAGATALTSVVAPADPCATAQQVAQANGAELAACTLDGEDVTVAVAVPTRILGIPRRADAAARAGPINRCERGRAVDPARAGMTRGG
ncbi:Rv3654c family TadE-like protein [Actinomyces ruminis]|uniref:Rv3654c family TadE-like protein n=1 Tax=Actinomyces ruminis TaxID=1937003 RepID=UPI0030B836AF